MTQIIVNNADKETDELIYDANPEARAIFEQSAPHSAIDFNEQRKKMMA